MAKVFGDRWEIVASLPEGGQGYVYRVRDKRDPEDGIGKYVLKRLKNLRRKDRFLQEIEGARRVVHPRVARVVDFDVDDAHPFLVMDYFEGGTLEAVAAYEFGLERVLEIFLDVCEGVAAAHAADVVHRDIKPANVLLERRDGRAVVADFGLCFLDEDHRFTSASEVIGSVHWTAPEVEAGRVEEVKKSTDVYVLGKLLYWLVTGRYLPREDLHEPGWQLSQSVGEPAAEHLTRFLANLIVRDPAKRLGDAGQVLVAARSMQRVVLEGLNAVGGRNQPCRYCGLGTYAAWFTGQLALGSAIGQQEAAGSRGPWRLLRCDQCGHVEFFNLGQGVSPQGRSQWEGLG